MLDLSIIIPTLNEEKYLPVLLKEIKKQKFNNYEIIVSDAGSKDRTLEIAGNFGCKIVNGGLPAKGRNEGAKIAQGKFFLFLDADTIYLPEFFFQKVFEEIKKRKLEIASFSIEPNGNWFDKLVYKIYNKWVVLTQNFLAHATNVIFVKKELFERLSGFDEEIKIGEDHEFVKRASKLSKFGFIELKPPILVSSRRFREKGRIKIYLKYLLAGICFYFFPSLLKKDIFKYY